MVDRLATFPAAALALAVSIGSPTMAQVMPGDVAAREGTIRLESASPWNVDFAEDKCRLQRVFEHAGKRYALIIEQNAPERGFGMIIAGPELARFRKNKFFDFGLRSDLPLRRRDNFRGGDLADFGAAIVMTSVSIAAPREQGAGAEPLRSAGIDLDAAAKIERIVLASGKRGVSFETGNMKSAMEVLNACTENLLVAWGLDAEQHRSFQPARFLNELEIARRLQQAYPASALMQRDEAIFRLRAIVEPDGQMSDCALLLAAATGDFNSTACQIMKDARFKPARNSAGEPIRSYHSVVISYRIG